jgi:hypothetical protein
MDAETAWLAGILEGEGYFGIKHGRKTLQIMCQMTDLDVLERLQVRFGGYITLTKKRKEHHRESWMWAIHGEPAHLVICEIYDLMSGRRRAKIDESLAVYLASEFYLKHYAPK